MPGLGPSSLEMSLTLDNSFQARITQAYICDRCCIPRSLAPHTLLPGSSTHPLHPHPYLYVSVSDFASILIKFLLEEMCRFLSSGSLVSLWILTLRPSVFYQACWLHVFWELAPLVFWVLIQVCKKLLERLELSAESSRMQFVHTLQLGFNILEIVTDWLGS